VLVVFRIVDNKDGTFRPWGTGVRRASLLLQQLETRDAENWIAHRSQGSPRTSALDSSPSPSSPSCPGGSWSRLQQTSFSESFVSRTSRRKLNLPCDTAFFSWRWLSKLQDLRRYQDPFSEPRPLHQYDSEGNLVSRPPISFRFETGVDVWQFLHRFITHTSIPTRSLIVSERSTIKISQEEPFKVVSQVSEARQPDLLSAAHLSIFPSRTPSSLGTICSVSALDSIRNVLVWSSPSLHVTASRLPRNTILSDVDERYLPLVRADSELKSETLRRNRTTRKKVSNSHPSQDASLVFCSRFRSSRAVVLDVS